MRTRTMLMLPFILACIALVDHPSPTMAEKRVALVVGVGEYQVVHPLKTPVDDATAVAAKLEASGFDTTLVTNPHLKGLRRSIASFEDVAGQADVALFYYAGHAVQVQEQNYLLPTDINPQVEADLTSDGVPLARVRRALGQAKLRVIILDACRDNPFATRFPAHSRSITRGLAPEPSEASTLIAFSASPGQTADDGDTGHSPYASALLKHILTPGLELSVLLLRISGEVRQATKNKQTPIITDNRDREFYFVSATATAPADSSQLSIIGNQAVSEQPGQTQYGSADVRNSGPSSERHLIVQDVVVVDQPGIGKTPIGRLRVGEIVTGLPYKSERWRAIQMENGIQGFVNIIATRPLQ
jgi:Caspase domain